MWTENAVSCARHPKKHFLYVGRLQHRKGLDELLRGFAAYHRAVVASVPMKLVIVGDGPIRVELENLSRALNIAESVMFWGAATDPEVLKELFSGALAYVSPGHVGLGVLHAFSYGVPVITQVHGQHAPEAQWLRHMENSILIDEGPEHLASGLIYASQDAEKCAEMGDSAFAVYSNEASPTAMLSGFARAIGVATGPS
nr:glycosyltransferase [Mesorhizobium sp.]